MAYWYITPFTFFKFSDLWLVISHNAKLMLLEKKIKKRGKWSLYTNEGGKMSEGAGWAEWPWCGLKNDLQRVAEGQRKIQGNIYSSETKGKSAPKHSQKNYWNSNQKVNCALKGGKTMQNNNNNNNKNGWTIAQWKWGRPYLHNKPGLF